MQDHTIVKNGLRKTFREFVKDDSPVNLTKRLERMHSKAIREPGTISVFQRIINRTDPCPCGSGKIFKFCCRSKVNKGRFEIQSKVKK